MHAMVPGTDARIIWRHVPSGLLRWAAGTGPLSLILLACLILLMWMRGAVVLLVLATM